MSLITDIENLKRLLGINGYPSHAVAGLANESLKDHKLRLQKMRDAIINKNKSVRLPTTSKKVNSYVKALQIAQPRLKIELKNFNTLEEYSAYIKNRLLNIIKEGYEINELKNIDALKSISLALNLCPRPQGIHETQDSYFCSLRQFLLDVLDDKPKNTEPAKIEALTELDKTLIPNQQVILDNITACKKILWDLYKRKLQQNKGEGLWPYYFRLKNYLNEVTLQESILRLEKLLDQHYIKYIKIAGDRLKDKKYYDYLKQHEYLIEEPLEPVKTETIGATAHKVLRVMNGCPSDVPIKLAEPAKTNPAVNETQFFDGLLLRYFPEDKKEEVVSGVCNNEYWEQGKRREHRTEKPTNDQVNKPAHYTDGKIEVIDFLEDKQLGFHLGNTVKYISRAGKKDPAKTVEDLEKAAWYLNRYIQILKKKTDETKTNK